MARHSLPAAGPARARSRASSWLDATLPALVALVAVAAVTWLGLGLSSWPDWTAEALPSVNALLAGHAAEFLRAAPIYGGSLLLRAPFMAVTGLWHGGGQAVYRAGAAPCMAALAALGLWLAHQMRRRGGGRLAEATAVTLCIANPMVVPALQLGHPEELLGAALCVAAVLCAQRGHAVWGGVLVGVAIANKPWGVLAAGPLLVALPRDRGRALIAMLLTAGAMFAPFLLVGDGGVSGQAAGVAVDSGTIFNPWQLWWFLGSHRPGAGALRFAPAWLGPLGHTIPLAIMGPVTLAYAAGTGRRAGRRGSDALLLLALLLLLRCALDPWNISYYALPFLTALLAWETGTHDRPPLVTLVASFVAWYVLQESAVVFGTAESPMALLYTIAVLPAIAAIGHRLFARNPITELGHSARGAAARSANPERPTIVGADAPAPDGRAVTLTV